MKYFSKLYLGLFLFLITVPSVFAQTATPSEDFFSAGKAVVLTDAVDGDAFIAGGNVVVSGSIAGDLLVAGGTITIQGNISGNVRAVGGNIIVTGAVGKNVSLAGGAIAIADSAIIGGNVVYFSGESAQISEGAQITGVVTKQIMPIPEVKERDIENAKEKAIKGFAALFVVTKILGFLSSLVIGLILIHLLPVYTKHAAARVKQEFWKSLGIGLIVSIMLPVSIFLLFITIVGIPIAVAAIFVSMVLCYISYILGSLATGNFISDKFNRKMTPSGSFMLGLVIFLILSFVPVLGKMIMVFVSLSAIGAIVSQHLATYQDLRNKKIV